MDLKIDTETRAVMILPFNLFYFKLNLIFKTVNFVKKIY